MTNGKGKASSSDNTAYQLLGFLSITAWTSLTEHCKLFFDLY